MMRILFVLVLVLGLGRTVSFGQHRSVSVIHNNQMFNYTITRYSPAWEVQSGKSNEQKQISEHSKLIKKVDEANVSNLKNLLYSKGFVPAEIARMNGSSMESYLAQKRLVMHYRIQYHNHTIFIAHLNNSSTRSVIPFRIEGSKWILDPQFADSDFYGLVSQPYYDVYTGSFNGQAYAYFAFEEIEKNGIVYDYSGHSNHGVASKATVVVGRLGGAMRLGQDMVFDVDLVGEKELKGDHFTIDGHLNISGNIFNQERKRVVFSVQRENGISMEMFIENGNINVRAVGAGTLTVPIPNKDIWFHFSIKQSGKKLSLEIDGEELRATTIQGGDILYGSRFNFGGRYSFKGLLDEFRIAK